MRTIPTDLRDGAFLLNAIRCGELIVEWRRKYLEVSLNRYLLDHEVNNPGLGAEFCHLMVQLAFAAKIMAREITLAPLVVESGLAGARALVPGHTYRVSVESRNHTYTWTFRAGKAEPLRSSDSTR